MKSQWNTAWVLLLALKAFGLKEGHPRGSLGLQCHLLLPREDMNCSWSAQFANSPHILFFYQNLNIDPDEVHRVQVPLGQNWLVIARSQLMVGDRYRVWLEVHHADWMEESEKLTFRPYEKVKPLAPELDPVVVSSSGVTVKWKTPYWSEQLSHQPLVCELRYKTSKDAVWASLGVDHVSQEGHEFEDLDPFTRYSVQVRCIPEDGQGTWSEWSPPQTFRTPEAAPLGQVDVWRSRNLSENAEPRLYLLWKALDQKAARGDILNYTVDFWDHHKTLVASSISVCCSIPIPASASYVQVSAFNSAGKTLPASLNLGQTDLPGPQDVWVLAVPNLGFNVTWTLSPTPGGAQPEHYVVECREEISRELADWISKPVGCSSTLLKGDYRPTEPYLVSVYAIYVDGSNSSAPVRAYVKEGAPSVGPQAVKDESVSSTASLISWEEIPLANQNGHLTHVTIYLKHPTPAGPKIFGPIAAKERSYALEGLDPGTSYELWMTGSTSAGEGPASPVHKFHTPGARWQISLVVLLSVGFLLIVAIVVVIIRRRWFLGLCHKVLPLWCWESVPDPGRSTVFVRMEDQRAALAQDSSSQAPPEPPEEPDVLEITEPAPPQTANPPRVVFSGYEKHFMPSREELQELT